jgi:microcystin-dependent protein
VGALWVNAQSVPGSYGPPTTVPYSGELRSGGVAINAATDVEFFLVTAQGQGWDDRIWDETHNVTPANGRFHVVLGTVSAFANDTFMRSELYLGMRVDGVELAGLQRLTRTPYTVQAAQAYDAVDAVNAEYALHGVPAGTVVPYAGNSLPEGWLWCDGASYATSSYPDLAASIGTLHGGSGGSFNVPNMYNRYAIGSGNGVNTGQVVGTNTNNLAHTHGAGSYGAHVSLSWTSGTGNKIIFDKAGGNFTADRHVGAGTFTESGLAQGGVNKTVVSGVSSSAQGDVENRPASVGLRYIIKY